MLAVLLAGGQPALSQAAQLIETEPEGLAALLFEGPELHPALEMADLATMPARELPSPLIQSNPLLTDDPELVRIISRHGAQGRNLSTGQMTAGLYARYLGDGDLGLYALEARTDADADSRETELRQIWSHNVGLDRTRVYRQGRILVVIWHRVVEDEIWKAANARLAERLAELD